MGLGSVGILRLQLSGSIAGLHAQKAHNARHRLVHLFELEGKLFQNLVSVSNHLPALAEVRDGDLGHEIGSGDFQVLEGVFFLEGSSLFLSGGWVDLDHRKPQLAGKAAGSEGGIGAAFQNSKAVLVFSVADSLGGNLARSRKDFRHAIVDEDGDIVEPLFFNSVLDVELKNHVVLEYVFGDLDNVFGFVLGKHNGCRRSEGTSEVREFGNGVDNRGGIDNLLFLGSFKTVHVEDILIASVHGDGNLFGRVLDNRECLKGDFLGRSHRHGCVHVGGHASFQLVKGHGHGFQQDVSGGIALYRNILRNVIGLGILRRRHVWVGVHGILQDGDGNRGTIPRFVVLVVQAALQQSHDGAS
mmetsp:Transcript_9826/g.24490  ORF Transcript_9826/g.24490 Transcript_9826/m.24490 type:complete len:357 (+) Transcript_9826:397-1467(+)